MSTLPTLHVSPAPVSASTIAAAKKLVAAHATLPLGELPSETALVAANEAFKQRWQQLPHQIENFFCTLYPHTKDEAEAFLEYAERTKDGVEIVLFKDDLARKLPVKSLVNPDGSKVKVESKVKI